MSSGCELAVAGVLSEHVDGLEKMVRELEPDLLSAREAEDLISEFARAEKLAASGRTLLSRLIRDAKALAKAAGITEGEAAQSVTASDTIAEQPELDDAVRSGELSADQTNAVAKGAKANPKRLRKLLRAAREKSVNELREEARNAELESKDRNDLRRRQRAARHLRFWKDDLGMACGQYRLTPETGAAVRAAIEAEAKRLHRATRHDDDPAGYPGSLADALANLVAGARGSGTGVKTEVVIDISRDAVVRGWVNDGEVCEVRGFGPIPVWLAKDLMNDAFLKAVVTDGTDVHLVKHFGHHIPADLKTALRWKYRGCVDCGSTFHLEDDHVRPVAANGPTSYANIEPRCWPCHVKKTEEDRRQGLLGKEPPRRRRE